MASINTIVKRKQYLCPGKSAAGATAADGAGYGS